MFSYQMYCHFDYIFHFGAISHDSDCAYCVMHGWVNIDYPLLRFRYGYYAPSACWPLVHCRISAHSFHSNFTCKSVTLTAPSCIDMQLKEYHSANRGFGQFQASASVWERAPMSIGKNQVIGSFIATNFLVMFWFHSKFRFHVMKSPHNI